MVEGDRFAEKLHFDYRLDKLKSSDGTYVEKYRPRIEVVIQKNAEHVNLTNTKGLHVHGLVDSGADDCYVPKKIADLIGLELDENTKRESMGANGKFMTYRTKMYLEMVYNEQRIGIDMVDVIVPEKDPLGIDPKHHVLIGRSALFTKYTVTFDESNRSINLKK